MRPIGCNGAVSKRPRPTVCRQAAPYTPALSGAPFATAGPILEKLLDSNTAAAVTLASFSEPEAAAMLIAHWKSYAPEARTKVIGALLGRREWTPLLLKALEDRRIEPAALDITARVRLLESGGVDLEPIVAREYKLADGLEAMAEAARPGTLKVLLTN